MATATSRVPSDRLGRRDLLAELGVPRLINAAGPYTGLCGSIMAPAVRAAWESAADTFVRLDELHDAVGMRIASLLGAEAAMVTAGAASAMTLGTAACVTGDDADFIHRLPDPVGMRDEVIVQRSHRFGYDHAIRACGVRLIEIETAEEFGRSVGPRTAMALFLNHAEPEGFIRLAEFATLGQSHGVPTLIDCAGDLPPVQNLSRFIEAGFDLVAVSGGKGLGAPQSTGLLFGRRDLIAAARLNGPPNADSIGRGMKVNKEEMLALLVAVEQYLVRDHAAEWLEWERRVAVIAGSITGVAGVTVEPFVPPIAAHSPHLRIRWDPKVIPLGYEDVRQMLRDGDPPIEIVPNPQAGLEVAVWMLRRSEVPAVAARLSDVLLHASDPTL